MRTLRSSLPGILRALAACAAMLAGRTIAAADASVAPAAQPEKYTYIVVLHDRASNDGHTPPAEPDIPAMGGEVVEQWRNRRVIRMPANAVRALVAHRAVKYIQRVQTTGPLPAVPLASAIASDAIIAADWAPPTWSSGTYVYDSEGNITTIGPGSDGGSETFTYDSAGRLVNAVTTHGGTHSEQYTYDSFGNLLNTARTAGPSTATPTDPATNRLQGVAYDAAGSVVLAEGGTAEYYYDGLNMLRAKNTSSGVAWYLYTADDERIGVQENGQSRWMVRDLSGKVLREWEGTSTWVWVEDYVHRGGALTAAEREPAEGGTRHFHLDHLGTPRLITDATGAKVALHDYFPFGVEQTDFRQEMLERGTDRPEPMKFTGHERDFTAGTDTNNRNQLDYMHARYYSPVWGRFLSVDPGRDWDLRQPQSWNMYAYVRNNPINRIDRTGRCGEDPSKLIGPIQPCAASSESKPQKQPKTVKPEPPGGPPVPVPGAPDSDWKFNPDAQNPRGGTYGPTKPRKGHGGGKPSASWEGGAPVPHWDVDDGKGNRRRYDQDGNFITPGEAHGTKRTTTLSPGEVVGVVGLAIFGTAITIMTGGGAALQPSGAGVVIVPTTLRPEDLDKECPTCT